MAEGKRWVPFAWGFRPFFLLAGLYAVVSVAVWLFVYANGSAPFGPIAPSLWHAHEMLYGFVGAAIGGFLLTAVPNWTGTRSISGMPLAGLALVWVAGRLAIACSDFLPGAVVALFALAFIPGVMANVLKSLFGSDDRRLPLVAILIAYWLTDAAFLYGVFTGDPGTARSALGAGIGVVLLLVTIIGGRIVPVFTVNALRRTDHDVAIRATPRLDRVVIFSMVIYLLADLLGPDTLWLATIAGLAGLLQLWRFGHWRGHRTRHDPVLWILHVAYAALPLGLLLRTVSLTTGAAWTGHWQHVLTIGAAATMILAVMTRAALGHTGRPLKVARVIVVAYVALVAATLARVFGPAILPYKSSVMLAGGFWLLAFTGFSIVYAPILTRPRADGRPG